MKGSLYSGNFSKCATDWCKLLHGQKFQSLPWKKFSLFITLVVSFIPSFPSTLRISFPNHNKLDVFSNLSSEHGNMHWVLNRKTIFQYLLSFIIKYSLITVTVLNGTQLRVWTLIIQGVSSRFVWLDLISGSLNQNFVWVRGGLGPLWLY